MADPPSPARKKASPATLGGIGALLLVPTVALEELAAFDLFWPRLSGSLASLIGCVAFGMLAWGLADLAVDARPVAIIALVHSATFFLRLLAVAIAIGWLTTTVLYLQPLTMTVTWAGIGYLCLVNDERLGTTATVMGYLGFGVALLAIVGMFVLVMGGGGTGFLIYNVVRDVGRVAAGVLLAITMFTATE